MAQRAAANALACQIGIGDLERHPDRKREIGEVEVVRKSPWKSIPPSGGVSCSLASRRAYTVCTDDQATATLASVSAVKSPRAGAWAWLACASVNATASRLTAPAREDGLRCRP